MTKKPLLLLSMLALLAGACSTNTVETTGDPALGSVAVDDDAVMSEASPPVDALAFAQTLSQSAATTSARFEGRFSVAGFDEADPEQTAELVISGGFDQVSEAMSLTVDLGEFFGVAMASGNEQVPAGLENLFTEPMQLIVIGDQGWLKWSLLGFLTGGDDDVWMELGADDLGSATEGFGFSAGVANPIDLVGTLAGAGAVLEELGTETVRGVETRHLLARVDLASLSGELDAEKRSELEEQLGDLTATEFPMEIWVGVDDGLLHRYQVTVPGGAFVTGAQIDAASATLTFDIYDYGSAVTISPPPADQVISGDGLFLSS